MGMNLDTKARSAAYRERNAEELQNLRLYTLTELEPILGVTHRTLLQYVKDGKLKCVKIGGKWKISGERLNEFINGK